MKKKFSLSLKSVGLNGLIMFEKEDNLTIILPIGTIFEPVKHYRGTVRNHYCNEKEFFTNIDIDPPQVASFQIESFTEKMLENGWTQK